jgi:polysaccharide export outer membrane protein
MRVWSGDCSYEGVLKGETFMRNSTTLFRLLVFTTLCLNSPFLIGQQAAKLDVPQAAINVVRQPAPYTVGAGDVLNIFVWNEKDLSPVVVVRPDGVISVPLIGEVNVLGKTPVEIQLALQKRFQALVVDPRVTVTVAEIHSRVVYIIGEVARPGAYPLNSSLDVLQLIAQAGGLTPFASRKHIRVVAANGSAQIVPFDYKKVLHGAPENQRISLAPGDTVVVP